MNASTSLSSLYSTSAPNDEPGRVDVKATRNRAASNSSSLYAPSPIPIDRPQGSDLAYLRYQSSSRPSFGDEGMQTSSPTKRNIFGRERKASNTSLTRPDRGTLFSNAARTALSNSPLGRGLRQDSSSSTSYSLYSKSQSDLHSKPDFPSPISGTVDLPKISSVSYTPNSTVGVLSATPPSGDPNFLRSPTRSVAFSRSVDDLNRGLTPPPPLSPAALSAQGVPTTSTSDQGGNWGEHGVAANSRARASDVGTLRPDARRFDRSLNVGAATVGVGLSNVPMSLPSPTFSNASVRESAADGANRSSEYARHQRKTSRPLNNTAEAAAARVRPETERPTLAPGVTFDGLLNRNTHISMSIHQLAEGSGGGLRGGGREKEINKGWKPYRVILRDGKLHFFKPSNALAEEIKTLFPVSVVPEASASEASDGKGLSVDDIQRNKLSTRDLLAATSTTQHAESRNTQRRNLNESRLSAIMDAEEPAQAGADRWERFGRHEDLQLAESDVEPPTWAARIQGGSVDALSHEFVFATQSQGPPSEQECGTLLFAILLTLRRTRRPIQAFLFAIQKWATMALSSSSGATGSPDLVTDNTPESAFQEAVRSRLSQVANSDVVALAEEQARPSVLHALEDIIRDSLPPSFNEEQVTARLAKLSESQTSTASQEHTKTVDHTPVALTAAAFLKIDPAEFARQIHIFHASQLNSATLEERSMLRLVGNTSDIECKLLSFDWNHPHFLTRLVLEHILGNPAKASSPDEGSQQETKERATILRHWIAVASSLLRLQNIPAWLAICSALCSRAVTRLTLTWHFVASTDRMLVTNEWALLLGKLGWTEGADAQTSSLIEEAPFIKWSLAPSHTRTGSARNCLPYLGNAVLQARALPPLDASSGFLAINETSEVAVRIWDVEQSWRSSTLCASTVRPAHPRDEEMQHALYDLFRFKAPVGMANERKARRMTALFRGAVPRSLMSSSATPSEGIVRSFGELISLVPAHKPSSTVLCGSSRVSAWRNNQRSFVFNLSPPDGGHVLLQAHSAAEAHAWIQAIERASKEFAHAIPSGADMIKKGSAGGQSSVAKPANAPVVSLYGTDIKVLAEHEGRSVPVGLARMLEEVEKRGLREQGIYRISGAKSTIEALKLAFTQYPADSINLSQGEFSDVHTITGAIKQWFRDLPEPAVPFQSYHGLIEAERKENEEDRLYAIRDIIWDFPRAHFELLKRISEHLALVCDEGTHNLMAPHNIGLVFGTSLLNPPPGPSSVAESFGNIGKAAHIVKIILTMHEWLFEPEPEAEAEAEAEALPPLQADTDSPAEGDNEAGQERQELSGHHGGHAKEDEAGTDILGTDKMEDVLPSSALSQDEQAPHSLARTVDRDHASDESVATSQAVDPTDAEGNLTLQAAAPTLPLKSVSQASSDESRESSHDPAQRWLDNPLLTVDEGTIDSHASDSSMMRAVLGAHPTTHLQPGARQKHEPTTTDSTVTASEQIDQEAPPPPVLARPESRPSISRTSSSHQVFLDVEEDSSSSQASQQQSQQPRSPASAGRREHVVESVYLDATDAIGILHTPFDELKEEDEQEERETQEAEAEDGHQMEAPKQEYSNEGATNASEENRAGLDKSTLRAPEAPPAGGKLTNKVSA